MALAVKSNTMISKYRYCLTKEGKVVTADNPKGVELLIGEGCPVDDSMIKKFGFVNGEVKLAVEVKEAPKGQAEVLKPEAKESPKGK
jgi:hypothetical protein